LSQILSDIGTVVNEQLHWLIQRQQYKLVHLKKYYRLELD
jgi:hypothetical protein